MQPTTHIEHLLLQHEDKFNSKGGENYFTKYALLKDRLLKHEYIYTQAGFPGGNDHGPQHILRVLDHLNDVVGPSPLDHIDIYELYLAMMSVLYHDVGILLGRSGHAEKSEALLWLEGNDYLVTELDKELMGVAVRNHSSSQSIAENCLPYPQTSVVGGHEVRIRMVSALVRLADELDEDQRRGDQHLQRKLRLPDDSEVFWAFNRRVQGVKARPLQKIIDMNLRFEPEDLAWRVPYKNKDTGFVEASIDKIVKLGDELARCNAFLPEALRCERLQLTIQPLRGSTTWKTPKIYTIGERTSLQDLMASLPRELTSSTPQTTQEVVPSSHQPPPLANDAGASETLGSGPLKTAIASGHTESPVASQTLPAKLASGATRDHFLAAVKNVAAFGDTDIFPFPPEHYVFRDCPEETVNLLVKMHEDFDSWFPSRPPTHESTLAQAGYTGFRWATQLDPFWNAYFLGLVLAIGRDIEAARVPVSDATIFSYRFLYDESTARIFNPAVGWTEFQARSCDLAATHEYMVKCDIADFYARASHDRLTNSLYRVTRDTGTVRRVEIFLNHFGAGHKHGLPVGGPAARLLAEALLARADQILVENGIEFCRFADDYHMFARTEEEGYNALTFLTETLQLTEGLSLQKLKTRVTKCAEFLQNADAMVETGPNRSDQTLMQGAHKVLSMRLRFDPYSPTAIEDYARLRDAVREVDIVGMLGRELSKTRVHEALTRQLLRALKFVDRAARDEIVKMLFDKIRVLTPVFDTVMIVINEIFVELSAAVQSHACSTLANLIRAESGLMRVDLHLSYALRVLSNMPIPEHKGICTALFQKRPSKLIRRDIILIMAKWGATNWLSNLRALFSDLKPWERRALILASYSYGPEADAWRTSALPSFDDIEILLDYWATRRRLANNSSPIV